LLDYAARVDESQGVGPSLGQASRGAVLRLGGYQQRLRIVLVSRDRPFSEALAAHLDLLHWTLIVSQSPPSVDLLRRARPHAVLVDIGLLGPYWDGWLSRHPVRFPQVAVLVCTGRSSVKQRVRGLQAGADDWITKPCAVEEVAARLLAVVRSRRLGAGLDSTLPLRSGALEVRPDLLDAFVGGKPAGLTRREFDVLLCLVLHDGVLERELLGHEVWGYAMARGDRALDTVIRKLRAKLRRIAPGREFIETYWGVGYRFVREREQS
jgi:DNA-binding response OmpR family regulator